MELLNQFEKCYPEKKLAKELCESKIEKKACIRGKFVDDYNIINIIPYHSAPSLVIVKYIDLFFLL